ncbi:efflux RND transporter periplasmic adaptor subunit [Pseudoalteromonas sp. SG44-5]|uniref:efflux RND transporter periplasmic adaptor subunit n=1 Tax=Pseudoalteromonas sp. SG44-5 TaxID=2760960 RepID=UPI0015F8FE5B|nr:efflux RND transporter periplasmic adaptor subunit [Pseudoalteromonas sp. SG44-5]MBB1404958.1 efflux RND transporter periplasmic adaptor subunit [Pseudoalteromonas sp. SG44-5]
MNIKHVVKNRYTLCIALAVLLSGCSEPEVDTKIEKAPKPVKLITIKDTAHSNILTYPATVDAIKSAKLAFQVGGKIDKLNVIAAQSVLKGDELASLEKRNFINEVNSTKIQYETANNDFNRGIKLSKDGVISARDIEQLKSKKEVAQSRYDSAKKALTDSTLVAPYDAIVAAVPVEALENVNAGQHIVTLFGKGEMEVVVNIPSSIVATVDSRTGSRAFVLLESAANTPIPATFRRANLEADTSSQTYEVRFSFAVPQNLNILPGMNASLRIEFDNKSTTNEITLPTFAIFEENGQHYVWTVSESMIVSKTVVTLVNGIGEELVVTSGIKAGDVIVGAGANYVTDGMKVRAWTKS